MRRCVHARRARRAASPAAARVADHDPAQVREARLPVRGRRAARELEEQATAGVAALRDRSRR